MQLGEKICHWNTVWKVVDRALVRYEPDDDIEPIHHTALPCSDESRQQTVGLVSRKNVIEPRALFFDEGGVGAAFFLLPLLQQVWSETIDLLLLLRLVYAVKFFSA